VRYGWVSWIHGLNGHAVAAKMGNMVLCASRVWSTWVHKDGKVPAAVMLSAAKHLGLGILRFAQNDGWGETGVVSCSSPISRRVPRGSLAA